MNETYGYECSSYYLFESLASARSCYFETEEEIEIFKRLFERYLGKYVVVDQMYFGSEGYRVFLKTRSKSYVCKLYVERRRKLGKEIRHDFLQSPWKIVSEQVRVLHFMYARIVNKMRGRKGVLVQQRFRRFYFQSLEELQSAKCELEQLREIVSQPTTRYRVSERWKIGIDWVKVWGWNLVRSAMNKRFQDYVVHDLIKKTISAHNSPPP